MHSAMKNLRYLPALIALSGCGVASAVGTVVTAPVKVVSKAADMATTSQSEADERRGRQMREHDGEIGKWSRQREKYRRDCTVKGDRDACKKYDEAGRRLDSLYGN